MRNKLKPIAAGKSTRDNIMQHDTEPQIADVTHLRPSRISACVASMCFAGSIVANPIAPEVVHGSASFIRNGSHLEITNSHGAIINWQDFSIATQESVNFLQTHASSAILNRIVSNIPSNILGDLTSNGRVFIINPNGLIIGKDATIDTAGFVASTLNISDANFIAGRMKFVGDSGEIENHGYIATAPGGEVVLIAPSIENHGIIEAPDGSVVLAAGREVVLHSLQGGGLSYKVSAPGDKVLNIGQLVASNGSVKVFADQVFQQGTVSANRASRAADGTIVLEADSTLEVSGEISTQGDHVAGGDIHLLGTQVNVSQASINASGEGGGEVLIGGDYQGKGEVRNAANTNTDATTVIRADGGVNGAGGRVIVWSDNTTNTFAEITARGGTNSGDGGFVETSGKKTLDFGQPADVSATDGAAGTWLLDPEDIVIDDDHADSISTSLSGGSNVEVRTSDEGDGEGNITVDAPITKSDGDTAVTLTLDAHNRVDVNAPITTSAGPLNLTIKTGRQVATTDTTEETEMVEDEEPLTAEASANENVVTETESTETGEENQAVAEEGEQTEETGAEGNEEAPVENTGEVIESDEVEGAEEQLADTSDTDAPLEADIEPAQSTETESEVVTQDPVAQVPDVEQSFDEVETEEVAEQEQELDAFVDETTQQIVITENIDTGGGDVSINAGQSGDTVISADISSGDQAGLSAGNITIEGQRIAIVDDSIIDASAEEAGEITIGGGLQGQVEGIDNSEVVIIGSNASIQSNGGDEGDGGRIIVFSEHSSLISGNLSARGGSQSGNGGFIETSGMAALRVGQAPEVGANNGNAGDWLIDPLNISIVRTDSINSGIDPISPPALDWNVLPTTSGAYISTRSIEAVLESRNNVTINTANPLGTEDGNITVEDSIFVNGTYGGDLSLIADNNIYINNSIRITGSISLDAANSVFVGGRVESHGGLETVEVLAQTDITIGEGGRVRAKYGYVDLSVDNNIVINGEVSGLNINIAADSDNNGIGSVTIQTLQSTEFGGAIIGNVDTSSYYGGYDNSTQALNISGASVLIEANGCNGGNNCNGGVLLRGDVINIGTQSSVISGDINIVSQADVSDGTNYDGGGVRIVAYQELNIRTAGNLTIQTSDSIQYIDGVGLKPQNGASSYDYGFSNTVSISVEGDGASQLIQARDLSLISGAGPNSSISLRAENPDFTNVYGAPATQTIDVATLTLDATKTIQTGVGAYDPRGGTVQLFSQGAQNIDVDGVLDLRGYLIGQQQLFTYGNQRYSASIVSENQQTIDVGALLLLSYGEIVGRTGYSYYTPMMGTGGNVVDNSVDAISTLNAANINSNHGFISLQRDQAVDSSQFNITTTGQASVIQGGGFDNNGLLLESVNWQQDGTVDWNGGNLVIDTSTVNFISGTLLVGPDSTFANYGQFNANAETGSFDFNVYGGGYGTIANSFTGTFIKNNGAGTSYVNAILENRGSVIAESGIIHLGEGTLTQSVGETVLRGGSIQNDAAGTSGGFVFTGGALRGGQSDIEGIRTGGSLISNVTVSNTIIDPGFSPGEIVVNGNFDASGGGNLFQFEIYSQSGDHDLLTITGTANITTNNSFEVETTGLPYYGPGDPNNYNIYGRHTIITANGGFIDNVPTTQSLDSPVVNAFEVTDGATYFDIVFDSGPPPPPPPPPVIPPPPPAGPPNPPVIVVSGQPPPAPVPAPNPPQPPSEPEVIVVIIDDQSVAVPPDIIDVLVSLSDDEKEAYLQSERVREILKTVNMCIGKT